MGITATIDGVPCEIKHGARISRPETGPASFVGTLTMDDVGDRPHKGSVLSVADDDGPLFDGILDDSVTVTGVDGSTIDEVDVEVVAHDFNVLATRRFLEPGWFLPAGTSVKAIAEAIIGYIPGAILDPAQPDGPNISADMAAGKTRASEASDFVTKDTGWRWRIEKVGSDIVYSFFDPATENAPFDIPDGPSDTLTGELSVRYGSGDYANHVTIYGADGAFGADEDAGEIAAKGPYEFQGESQESDGTALTGIASILLALKLPLWEQAEVSYPTHAGGLKPGQTQTIVQTRRGVNGTFLISEIEITITSIVEYIVRVVEGIVYRPGWRQQLRDMFGGGSLGTLPTISGGGSSGGGLSFIRSWMWFGGNGQAVAAENADDWVDLSDWHQEIDTVTRGTTSVAMTGRARAFTPGVKIRLRLWNVDLGGAATGTSAQVTTGSADADGVTPFTTVTWTVSADAGSDRYKLQGQPDTAGVPIIGYAAGI